jgi:hypothetical protein
MLMLIVSLGLTETEEKQRHFFYYAGIHKSVNESQICSYLEKTQKLQSKYAWSIFLPDTVYYATECLIAS